MFKSFTYDQGEARYMKQIKHMKRGKMTSTARREALRKKRRIESRIRISMFGMLITLFLLLAGGPFAMFMTPGSMIVNADENLTELRYKTVKIQSEDSLWSIAEDNMTPGFRNIYSYIRDVKKINHLDSDVITAGCYLTVPYYEYK